MQTKMSRPTSSAFDKTRSYFESELLSDNALRELQQMNSIESKLVTGFRCTALEMTKEGILIVTNENFLFFGRKSFKNESFRRIQIDSDANIHVDHIALLTAPDEDIVLVALTDGTVKTLFCDQNRDQFDDTLTNSDAEDGGSASSGSSLPPNLDSVTPITAAPSSFVSYGGASSNGPVQVAVPFQSNTHFDGNVGKSCTIQSLVQNERKIYDETQALSYLDNNEYKTPLRRTESMQRSMRTTNLMNGQVIVNSSFGMFSRQTLIPLSKSFKIVILRKDRMCIFDISTSETTEVTAKQLGMKSFVGATTSVGHRDEEFLVSHHLRWCLV